MYYIHATGMKVPRKTRMFSLSQHIVFAHSWSIQFVGLQFLPDSLPDNNSIPLHETMVITWLIDSLSFLWPSCFSAFYYSSLNFLSLYLGQG